MSRDPAAIDWLSTGRVFFLARQQGEGPAIMPALFRATEGEASASDIAAVARLCDVPAAALKAIAEIEGDRRLCQIEANAGRLRRALDAGADLSDIFYPAVMARISQIEAAVGGMGA